MGKFLIFIGVVLVLCMIGLGVWWLGSKIYISICRETEHFEIEKEGYDKVKDGIKKSNK